MRVTSQTPIRCLSRFRISATLSNDKIDRGLISEGRMRGLSIEESDPFC